jgi:hypothetical protein
MPIIGSYLAYVVTRELLQRLTKINWLPDDYYRVVCRLCSYQVDYYRVVCRLCSYQMTITGFYLGNVVTR